jgi:hypothetical protein
VRWIKESQVGRKFSPNVEFLAHQPEEAMAAKQQLVTLRDHFWSSENCSKKQGGEKLFVHFAGSTRKSGCRAGLELLWFG